MSIWSKFFRSLLLTMLFSFAVPIVLVGGTLAALSLVSYIPGLEVVGGTGATQILKFLATFGSGSPIQGTLTIGLTTGVVGGLFDVSTFFRYYHLQGKQKRIEFPTRANQLPTTIPPECKQGMKTQS